MRAATGIYMNPLQTAFEFEVPGRVVAKQSGKIIRNPKTGRPMMMTKKNSKTYSNLVRMTFVEQNPVWRPLTGAISVFITAYFRIPKSYTKKRIKQIEDRGWLYTGKPDPDNIAKNILDSLNTVAWLDDKQVAINVVERLYINPEREQMERAVVRCHVHEQEDVV